MENIIRYPGVELDSDSDKEQEFDASMESLKYEEAEVAEIESIPLALPISPEIQKIPRAKQSLQSEKSLPSLCRLCAIPCTGMIDIFSSNVSQKSISKKIQHCLPITVEKTDALSKKVCQLCLQQLESFYQFHTTVIEAEKLLLVFHEQTSGKLTEEAGIPYQTPLQSTSQPVVEKNADNQETLMRGSDGDSNKHIESNESSDLGEDDVTKNSNCVNRNTEPFVETLNPGRISASKNKQDFCSAALNSPIGEERAEEKSKSGVSDSMNHSPLNIRRKSERVLKSRAISIRKCAYFLRKRKLVKYNSDNEDDLSCDEAINNEQSKASDSHAPAARNVGYLQLIKCNICKTVLQTIEECRAHARIHTSTNYHPCCFCRKILKTKPEWEEHWSQHDGNAYSPAEFKDAAQLYGCHECGRKFAMKIRLHIHILYHQTRVNNEPNPKSRDEVSESETPLQQRTMGVHRNWKTSSGNISAGKQFRNNKESDVHQKSDV